MKDDRCQRVVWRNCPRSPSDMKDINEILEEGFEIIDIVPYMTSRKGYGSGIDIDKALFHLIPSQRKTRLSYYYVPRDHLCEHINKINEIIKQEDEKERILFKIIPNEEIHEPMNGNGLGSGTFGFSLFFI